MGADQVIFNYLFLAATGRLLIYLAHKAPYLGYIETLLGGMFIRWGWSSGRQFLQELFACDLCLGVWVYWFLAFMFQLRFVPVPVVGELLVGCVTSFLVYVFSAGWVSLFVVYHLEG